MRWKLVLSAVLSLTMITSSWAQNAPEVVSHLPENALGLVVVKNLGELNSKIESLSKKIQQPLPQSPLDMLENFGIGKGLDRKGSLMAVMVPTGDEVDRWSYLVYVPVSDYKDFVTAIGGKAEEEITQVQLGFLPNLAAKRGKYAVLVAAGQKDILKKALTTSDATAKALTPAHGWIAENDLSAVATTNGIKTLSKEGQKHLGGFRESTPIPDEAKFMVGWFDAIQSFLKSSDTDISHIALGTRIDETGNVDLAGKAFFTKSGAYSKEMPSQEAGSFKGLPVLPYVFAMGGNMSGSTMKGFLSFNNQMMAAMFKDVPPEKLKKLEAVSEEFSKQLTGMSMVMGSGKGQEPLFANLYSILKVNDAKAYFKSYEDYLKTYNEVVRSAKVGNIPAQKFEVKSLTVEGKPALQVTSEMKFDENLGEIGKKMQDFYFGPGGKMVIMQVINDPKTVITSYSADSIKPALKTYQEKGTDLAEDASVKKTVALLPSGSQFILLLSPKGITEVINRGIEQLAPDSGIKIPAFPETPALGIGVRRASTSIEGHLSIPVGILENVGDYVKRVPRMKGNIRYEETR